MTLRNRLLMFSSAQLIVFGVVVAFGYWKLSHTILPMVEEHLRDKAVATARELTGSLDVALAADDRALLERDLAETLADPDFHYVEVRDAHGNEIVAHGTHSAGVTMSGEPRIAHADAGLVRAWMPITLEGTNFGSVEVVLDASRVADLQTWTRTVGVMSLGVWLLVFLYSLGFARSFVAPIRAMKQFAQRVAQGEFGEQLVTSAPGELGELKAHLNTMTAELQSREQERALAAARAEEMQRELLSVTRMAGMAEVATSVLHNVGNVLNSLNVSVSLVNDQLKGSKVASLTRTVELFDKHPGGLAAFLGTDKGKLVPGFLTTVSQRLVEENATARRELDSVVRNVEHIKTIVATQQAYTQVSGVREPVVAGELLDDALRMVESSFAKHGVEIVRDYGEVPILVTDRHKVLQILVNIVTNARHAIRDGANEHPRLTASIRPTEHGIAIAVSDTGIGIPPENIPKVFRHGFTTKRDGHGFGLHSCGNAVRELGGSIAVASAGSGLGATFTVELPLELPEKIHALAS